MDTDTQWGGSPGHTPPAPHLVVVFVVLLLLPPAPAPATGAPTLFWVSTPEAAQHDSPGGARVPQQPQGPREHGRLKESAGSSHGGACSGRVGAARLPSRRSRRSLAPDHVPGPSPSLAFPHPLVRRPPPRQTPGPSRSFRSPPTSARPESRSQKGKEVRTRARAADLEELRTLGSRDPGARVSSPTVLGEPGAHVALR